MPPDEIVYWQAYMQEPRGYQRMDYHAAQVTQAIYTIMASFGKNSKPIKFEDCILRFGSNEVTQEEADRRTLQAVAAIRALFGKKAAPFADTMQTKARKIAAVDKPATR